MFEPFEIISHSPLVLQVAYTSSRGSCDSTRDDLYMYSYSGA